MVGGSSWRAKRGVAEQAPEFCSHAERSYRKSVKKKERRILLIQGTPFCLRRKKTVDTHGQARGTFTAQASLDLNPAFPATAHI